MNLARLLRAGVVVLGASHAATAGTLHVRVVVAPGARVSSVRVVAEPRGILGSALPGAPVTREVSDAGPLAVELRPGIWSVRAVATGGWSWPVTVTAREGSTEPAEMSLTLWPTGSITGRFRLLDGQMPSEIRLFVRRGFGPVNTRQTLEDSITCPVRQNQWACQIPATIPLDLELNATGFAPCYLWDVIVGPRGSVDVGAVDLTQGASVTGWVLTASEKPARGADVELKAPDGGVVAIPTKSGTTPRLRASTNNRGFFQMGSVPPGMYHVVAAALGHISQAMPARVVKDREYRLASPLLLKPPLTLRVSVDPPQSADGRPWSIRLSSLHGSHSGHLLVHGELVSEDGRWSRPGLAAGSYRLAVVSDKGDAWHERQLDLQPGTEDQAVVIRTLNVVGSLALRDPIIGGRVLLADASSGARVWFDIGSEGDFSGSYPSVDLDKARWSAVVEASEPSIRQTIQGVQPDSATSTELKFVIRLPDGAIAGTVVDEQGLGQSAVVTTQEQESEGEDPSEGGNRAAILSLAQARSAESTGRFKLVGLKPGEYRVYAMGRPRTPADGLQSDTVTVRVGNDQASAPVTLVLKPSTLLRGRVVDGAGQGIPGASVLVVPAQAPDVMVRMLSTDVEGRFEAKVTAGTGNLNVVASAIGEGHRTLGRAVPENRMLEIGLDRTRSGLLVLAWGEGSDPSDMVLFHEGGFETWPSLRRWAEVNGEAPTGGVLRLPLMSPGSYRLCRVRSLRDHFAIMSGAAGEGRCAEGDLPPASDLRLSLPESNKAS